MNPYDPPAHDLYDPPAHDMYDAERTRRFPAWPIFGSAIGLILLALAVMIIPGIVFWLLLGYVGGWIFAKKGYPPKLGIVIGIFLGPMAIALCAVLPRTREGHEQAALEREINLEIAKNIGSKRCPKCDRELGISARVCPRCEHRIEAT